MMPNEGGNFIFQVITIVGTSPESWEKATAAAVETASKKVQVVGVKVEEFDTHVENGKVLLYGVKLKVTIKF
jgi:flavin-binding protein dodecin